MHPKDADRMANSIDLDQTADESRSDTGLGQHCLPRSLGKKRKEKKTCPIKILINA